MLRVASLAALTADWISSFVIRPDAPVPETNEISTSSSRASFLVAGDALTFGATEIKLLFSLKEGTDSSSSAPTGSLLIFSVEVS